MKSPMCAVGSTVWKSCDTDAERSPSPRLTAARSAASVTTPSSRSSSPTTYAPWASLSPRRRSAASGRSWTVEDQLRGTLQVVRRQHARTVDVRDELADVLVGRVRDDLRAGRALDDPALSHDHDLVADPHRLVEVVGHEHGGPLRSSACSSGAGPACRGGSAGRGPRTARPSAGWPGRRRAHGPARRAAACPRRARGAACRHGRPGRPARGPRRPARGARPCRRRGP